ncbi:hypothetical protein PUN28_007950 [Cardiocondyla obscurior]|uniref:Uncharacterized protein n=1 Tax=Cardiocondyla obscurior TaxID=286306 RepID=A0AAW2FV46_9HYME
MLFKKLARTSHARIRLNSSFSCHLNKSSIIGDWPLRNGNNGGSVIFRGDGNVRTLFITRPLLSGRDNFAGYRDNIAAAIHYVLSDGLRRN